MICWLTINRVCNMRCGWCYAQEQLSDNAANMTFSTLEKILKILNLTKISRFILLGGEPTILNDLPAIIERLKPANVALITNAVRLADKSYLATLRNKGLNTIMVSLKGATEEQYFINTGMACLRKVEQAIVNLNELEIQYSVSVTFSKSLLETLPGILEWMRSVNVRSMSINYCRPFITKGKISIEGVPSPKEMAEQTVACYDAIKESGVPCSYNFLMPLCLLPRKFIDKLVTNNELSTICQLQKGNGLIFMPDGTLIPCNHLFDYRLGKVGEDFNTAEEFDRYRREKRMQDFYRRAGSLPDERCRICSLKTRCGGGCFIQYLHHKPAELLAQPFEG